MARFVKYITTEQDKITTFIVGPRLDCFWEENNKLLKDNNIYIQGILSLTDRIVRVDSSYPKSAWFPWVEGKYASEELVFGALMTLRHWVYDLRLSTIYIHCDAGTHRAPTILGFYINSFSKEILNTEVIPIIPDPKQACFSNALVYAADYLRTEKIGDVYKKLLPIISENFNNYSSTGADFLENMLGEDWDFSILQSKREYGF